jgi:hypothetical protein
MMEAIEELLAIGKVDTVKDGIVLHMHRIGRVIDPSHPGILQTPICLAQTPWHEFELQDTLKSQKRGTEHVGHTTIPATNRNHNRV